MVVTRKRQGNKGARNKPEGSGTGYLRVSNGNAYLHVGPRSSYVRDNRSKPNEAQPKSQAQSPKELSTTDHGAKQLGFSLGPDLLTGANQVGIFNVGSATTQAQSVSVKSKKDLARSRAYITSVSVAEGPKSSPKSISLASISKLSNGTSERSDSKFLFTASARNELGDKFGGDDHRNSRGGHRRNSGQGEKRLETPSPTHEGKCSDRAPASDGPTLGKDSNAGETENNRMEDDSSDFAKPGVMRSESCREAIGEKDAGDRANSHMCQEQQEYHQASAGVSTHGGVQPSLSNHKGGFGNPCVLLNSNAGVRPIDGDAEADGMEFEGGGENPNSC